MKRYQQVSYKGFELTNRSKHADGWSVVFPGAAHNGGNRVRWGTIAEIQEDVDNFLQGTLAQHKKPF